jgi:hypothetical protein
MLLNTVIIGVFATHWATTAFTRHSTVFFSPYDYCLTPTHASISAIGVLPSCYVYPPSPPAQKRRIGGLFEIK